MVGEQPKQNYQKELILDCANGVGAQTVAQLLDLAGLQERLHVTLINNEAKPDLLNEGCGAEHVQKEQQLPANWSAETHANRKCMSFDGDADR